MGFHSLTPDSFLKFPFRPLQSHRYPPIHHFQQGHQAGGIDNTTEFIYDNAGNWSTSSYFLIICAPLGSYLLCYVVNFPLFKDASAVFVIMIF